MTEAERRAAWEAAVVKTFSVLLNRIIGEGVGNLGAYEAFSDAVANVRALQQTEPDAPAATEAGA